MPDIVPASTPDAGSSGSTGSSTADIAASVISDFESGGSGASDDPTPAASPTPTPTAQPDPDDFDAVQAETVDASGRKRTNSIPHPRVKTMIEKKVAARERELISTVAKELGITKAEAELKLDDVLGGLRERVTKFTEYEQRIHGVESVEALMVQDTDRFMQMLVKLNPSYAAYQKAEAQQQHQATNDDPEPEPDYDLGEGRRTYTLEGMRQRDEWKERQILKRIEGKMGERLKPFEEERQQREEAARNQREFEERREAIATDLKKRLEVARKWPQFVEHEKDIRSFMDAERAKGSFVRFEDAYMQVVMPKLAADRTKLRQEVIDEANALPKTTSVTPTPSAQKQTDKPKTTAEIAAEVIASMK